jgi:dihydrofolate reductase
MTTQGRPTVTTFLTLDGVLQAPGAPDEDPGRRTYDIFAAHWPRIPDRDDPVASALNRLPKYVASRTMEKADWRGTTVIRDVVKEVAELKRRYPREVQVHGSGDLARTLAEHELADEYRLWLYPVVLGGGKRLFGSGAVPAALTLAGTTTTSTGVVVSTYRRAGKPSYGSFGLDQ